MRRSLSRQTNRGKVLWCGQRLSILSCRESNHHPSLDRNQGSQRKYCRFSAAPLFTEAEENFNIRLFGHTCSFGVTSTGGPVAPLLFIAMYFSTNFCTRCIPAILISPLKPSTENGAPPPMISFKVTRVGKRSE